MLTSLFCSHNGSIEYNSGVHRLVRPTREISRALRGTCERCLDARQHNWSADYRVCFGSNVWHTRFTSRLVDRIGRDSNSALVFLVFASIAITCLASRVVFAQVESLSFETPYSHITIERTGSVVEMRSLWRRRLYRESAVDLNNPAQLIVPYTRAIAASAMFHPKPRHALMIGLGGGGFNQFFEKAFPSTTLETVEIDSKVCELAQKYLGFRPSERNKVKILDGRMFLRHSKAIYDWIILDAFRGGFVPPHLKTVEFYKLAQSHLAPDGLFVANVRTDSSLFVADVRTLRQVFPQLGMFDVPQTANAVLVAANFHQPTLEEMAKKAGHLTFNEVFRHSVDPVAAAKSFHPIVRELSKNAPILTDDFAPTEFLDTVKMKETAR
jgi:spermidine synthase